MAQLKDTVVSGSLRATDTIYTTTEQLQSLKIPDSSGSSTYTTGTAGQIMRTNGSTVYWATGNSAISVTATSAGWSNGSQTISNVTGVTATNNIVVGLAPTATAEQYDAACAAKILCTAQGAGTITLTAHGATPSVNIPFTVIVTG